MGEKGVVISKQQLSDEFLYGFHTCKGMRKVDKTDVCLETDINAVWQVLVFLMEHDAEEDGEQWGGGGGCTPLRWGSCLTVTHCASCDLADLHAAGGGW